MSKVEIIVERKHPTRVRFSHFRTYTNRSHVNEVMFDVDVTAKKESGTDSHIPNPHGFSQLWTGSQYQWRVSVKNAKKSAPRALIGEVD